MKLNSKWCMRDSQIKQNENYWHLGTRGQLRLHCSTIAETFLKRHCKLNTIPLPQLLLLWRFKKSTKIKKHKKLWDSVTKKPISSLIIKLITSQYADVKLQVRKQCSQFPHGSIQAISETKTFHWHCKKINTAATKVDWLGLDGNFSTNRLYRSCRPINKGWSVKILRLIRAKSVS